MEKSERFFTFTLFRKTLLTLMLCLNLHRICYAHIVYVWGMIYYDKIS